MAHMKINIVFEDKNLLVADKPAGIIVFREDKTDEKTLIDLLVKKYQNLKNVGEAPRYGIVHRLDKDTSGLLLVAKNNETLFFLQKQFQQRKVIKKYIALVNGEVKKEKGVIDTLIGRGLKDRKKQKVYLPFEPGAENKRQAVTNYNVLKRFIDKKKNKYTLVEVEIKTGRKHQIRAHFQYLNHPVCGDKMYGFKNQVEPNGLKRQFLHASILKIKIPDGSEKEFKSKLPKHLNNALNNLEEVSN
ncbi:MAG: RluA family pseudouridine synthase [Candidatus Nealsonbacteria bacterium]